MARRKKESSLPIVRTKLWIEIDSSPAALTEAGADLLEQIEAWGSLSEAARRLGFAYRRAWLLVDAMNKAWPEPLVTTATGGQRGGGAQLTMLGRHVLKSFRDVQLRLEHFIETLGDPFSPAP